MQKHSSRNLDPHNSFLSKKDTSIYTQRQWASRALCEFIYFICIFWRSQPGQQGLLGLLMFAFQITATLSRPPTPTTTRCLQKDEIQPALPLYWISIQINVQWISPIISMNMPPTNKHTPTIIWGEKRDEKDFLMFPKKQIFCLSLDAKLFTHYDVWWWRWLFLLHQRAVEALCSNDFSATSSIRPSQC